MLKNDMMKDMAGIILFYLLIVLCVLVMNSSVTNIPEVTNSIVTSNN